MKTTMMKRMLLTLTVVMGMAATPASAQGLGDLLKKAKKVVDKVTNTTSTTNSGNAIVSKGTTVKLPNGGTLQNPLSQLCDIQLVGVYGKSTSLNYGKVYLVLKVKMIANETKLGIGSNFDYQAILVDGEGNTSKLSSCWAYWDVTEGIYVKLNLDKFVDPETYQFPDVRKTAKVAQVLSICISTDSDHTGLLTLRNVPIQWDVEPE